MVERTADEVWAFFARSDELDRQVLRPLGHIAANWEASWDPECQRYAPEPDSFADDLNAVIDAIAATPVPERYHDHEDRIAEHAINHLGWPIQKRGARWIGANYSSILENGSFHDLDQCNLIAAASGRVQKAIDFGQQDFDTMEDGHRAMLAILVTVILYQRYAYGKHLMREAVD